MMLNVENVTSEEGNVDQIPDQPATTATVERVADYFVGYLFDRYQGTRYVRRVATWLGFLLKAIERVAGNSLGRSRSRQITFNYRDRHFKARFNHLTGARGGIEIVEVLPGRGPQKATWRSA